MAGRLSTVVLFPSSKMPFAVSPGRAAEPEGTGAVATSAPGSPCQPVSGLVHVVGTGWVRGNGRGQEGPVGVPWPLRARAHRSSVSCCICTWGRGGSSPQRWQRLWEEALQEGPWLGGCVRPWSQVPVHSRPLPGVGSGSPGQFPGRAFLPEIPVGPALRKRAAGKRRAPPRLPLLRPTSLERQCRGAGLPHSCLVWARAVPPSSQPLHTSHRGLLTVPGVRHVPPCLRAFALVSCN